MISLWMDISSLILVKERRKICEKKGFEESADFSMRDMYVKCDYMQKVKLKRA